MPQTPPIKVPIVGQDKYAKEFKKLVTTVKKVGDSVQSAGRSLTTKLTVPLVAAAGASTKLAVDLNKGLANVGTLIPGQTKRLEKFKLEVQDLSIVVGQSTTTITEGLYETISAFGDAEDPMNKLTISSKAGAAGLSTTTEAMKLLSAVTKGYNDTSDEAFQKASDLSFMTVKLGQTTFPELAASMGKAIPLAKNLNISQEELFGSFATLTGVTGNAAEVSTQLTGAMTAMVKPTGEMTRLAQKLGFASASTMVKEKGLIYTLTALSGAVDGNVDKMSKLMKRKEGLTAALALTGAQADTFRTKFKKMGDVTGTTAEAFHAQTQGINKVGFAFEQSKRRVIVSMQKIGDVLLPIFAKIMDKVAPFIQKLSKVNKTTIEFGLKIAAAAALIGPALMIIGKIISVGASVAGALGGMSGAAALLTGPVGAAALAIFAVGAAVIYLWDEIEPVRNSIKSSFIPVLNDIKVVGQDAKEMFIQLGAAAKEFASEASPLLALPMKAFFTGLLLPARASWAVIRHLVRVVKLAISVFRNAGKVAQFFGMKIKAFVAPILNKVSYAFVRLKINILHAAKSLKIIGRAVATGLGARLVRMFPILGKFYRWIIKIKDSALVLLKPFKKIGDFVAKVVPKIANVFGKETKAAGALPKIAAAGKGLGAGKTSHLFKSEQGLNNEMLAELKGVIQEKGEVVVSFKDMPRGVSVTSVNGPVTVDEGTGPILEGGI